MTFNQQNFQTQRAKRGLSWKNEVKGQEIKLFNKVSKANIVMIKHYVRF